MDSAGQASRGPAYSIWLLPAEPAASQLARLVTELAGPFGSPPFPPHVTIQGSLQQPLRVVAGIAAELAAGHGAELWPVAGLDTSDEPFRSFYLALTAGPAFAALMEAAAAASGTRVGLPPLAHLSLAYGALAPARKDALWRHVAARLPAMLAFDRIAVALAGPSVGVASWRTLEAFALTG